MNHMGTSVAEYLGQRTDVDFPIITPIIFPERIRRKINWTDDNSCPACPFSNGNKCKKLVSGLEPVCSVRKSDGTLWINCSERLCSTKKDLPLNEHQKNILLQVGRHIFSPETTASDICVKREECLSVIEGKMADVLEAVLLGVIFQILLLVGDGIGFASKIIVSRQTLIECSDFLCFRHLLYLLSYGIFQFRTIKFIVLIKYSLLGQVRWR